MIMFEFAIFPKFKFPVTDSIIFLICSLPINI
jgi:hypothetical protein